MTVYSVENATSEEECDLLLAEAAEDVRILNDEKTILGVAQGKAEKVSTVVQAEISATKLELTGIEGLIPTLPTVKKRIYERKKVRLENKLDTLGFRKEDQGSIRLIKKQFELGKIEAQLEEIARFVAAVEARKAVIIAG